MRQKAPLIGPISHTHVPPSGHPIGVLLSVMKQSKNGSSCYSSSQVASWWCCTDEIYLDSRQLKKSQQSSCILHDSLLITQSVSLLLKCTFRILKLECVWHLVFPFPWDCISLILPSQPPFGKAAGRYDLIIWNKNKKASAWNMQAQDYRRGSPMFLCATC